MQSHAILAATMAIPRGEIEKAAEILKKGGLVAFPTDTVYGLGADAFNPRAVERIFQIKNRPKNLPLPVLIAAVEQLSVLANPIPEVAWFLIKRFWPGGLTLVLNRADSVPSHLCPGLSIGIRLPNHPICLALIRHAGNPIIGTSANLSGQPAALTAAEVAQQLGSKVDFILDGGKCPGGKESTVVDVTREPPAILRHGIVPASEIQRAYQEYLDIRQCGSL